MEFVVVVQSLFHAPLLQLDENDIISEQSEPDGLNYNGR